MWRTSLVCGSHLPSPRSELRGPGGSVPKDRSRHKVRVALYCSDLRRLLSIRCTEETTGASSAIRPRGCSAGSVLSPVAVAFRAHRFCCGLSLVVGGVRRPDHFLRDPYPAEPGMGTRFRMRVGCAVWVFVRSPERR